MTRIGTLIPVAMLVVLLVAGCSEMREATLERGVQLFLDNRLEEARPVLEASTKLWKDNPEAFAWYAECLRRLGRYDEAATAAYAAVGMDAEHAFAHTVLGDLYNPQYSTWPRADSDSTWVHLREAVKYDPADGNAWSTLWVQAMMRGDRQVEQTAAVRMIDSGFLSKPVLAYNRWELEHLPENAILLTNGDMDTYPAVALMAKEGLRQDVALINLSLLNMPWYQRLMAERYGLPLVAEVDTPVEDAGGGVALPSKQVVRMWMDLEKAGELGRPLCAAITVSDLDFTDDAARRMVLCGPFYQIYAASAPSEVDVARLKNSLDSIKPPEFEGEFATPIDRSPVRRQGTNRLATNVTSAMLRYASALADEDRWEDASAMLAQAEEFDSKIIAGGEFGDQMRALRGKIDINISQQQ
jgi:tetratricopeptide (TPR) repeat protein